MDFVNAACFSSNMTFDIIINKTEILYISQDRPWEKAFKGIATCSSFFLKRYFWVKHAVNLFNMQFKMFEPTPP